jgi:hypothetical protein
LASLWGRQQLAVGEQVGELFLLAGVADEALTAGRPATMKEGVVGVERFAVDVPQATLDDLDARLARTRWPGELDGAGWEDGTSPAFLQELVGWWQTGFDWVLDATQPARAQASPPRHTPSSSPSAVPPAWHSQRSRPGRSGHQRTTRRRRRPVLLFENG